MFNNIFYLLLPQIIGLIYLLVIFVISDFYKNIYGGLGFLLIFPVLLLLAFWEHKRETLVKKAFPGKRIKIFLLVYFIPIFLGYGAHFVFGFNKSAMVHFSWGFVMIVGSYTHYKKIWNRPSFSLALFGWFIIGDAISKLLLGN